MVRRRGGRCSLAAAAAAAAASSSSALALPAPPHKAWRRGAAAEPVLVGLHRQVLWLGDKDQMATAHAYFGSIALGRPHPQEFAMVFDTGSGHVVVPSKDCQSASCWRHRAYDCEASSTAEPINAKGQLVTPEGDRDQVTVEFGTGEVTGEFVREVVRLGPEQSPVANGTSEGELTVEMHVVTALAMSSDPFEALAFDGIFGLGLDALAVAQGFSFLGQLAAKGGGLEPQFAVFLANGDEEQSEIAFGGHNPEHLLSPLTWAPVVAPELGHWQVAVRGVRLGNRSLSLCGSAAGCRGVVDSGTSALGVPVGAWQEMEEALCAATSAAASAVSPLFRVTAPAAAQLHLDLDGVTLTLGPEEYAEDAQTEEASADAAAEKPCRPRVIPLDAHPDLGNSFLILGEPVLRRYYTVFDRRGPRIGFGEARHQRPEEDSLPAHSPAGGLLGQAADPTLLAIAARRAAAA